MAQWTDYWRIVKPKRAREEYDTRTVEDFYGSAYFNNYSWYAQVMKGASSRLQRYAQFEAMDSDADIARALDIIAEEMTNINEKTGLPFIIEYQNDDNKEVEESIVMTIRAALRHWSDIQDIDNRAFRIARNTVKYGDCFFRKSSDHKTWQYIDPNNVLGIELDKENNTVAYHLRKNFNSSKVGAYADIEIVPAAGIIHFTLSDQMTGTAPFGDSIMTPVIRAYKQLGLLEDSVVIYRVVRAPERRVFYIDVGNMPPHKVKNYLESVKNDIRQKRVPNSYGGGKEKVDSIYNPMSMTEDYFFSTTANGRGSRVDTLQGGENLGEITDLQYFQDRVFRGMRVPTSYMKGQDANGAQYNDGKVGIAYIEELRFANFVRRLQNKIECIFDEQFKRYLKVSGIRIDEHLFKIKFPDPQNFALYRQAALDSELINTFTAADGIKYLSKRLILKRYLGFNEDDIQTNEALLRQELAVPDTTEAEEQGKHVIMTDIQYMYDPAVIDGRQVEVPKSEEIIQEPGGEEEQPAETPPEGEEAGAEGEAPAETPPEETGGEAPAETPPEETGAEAGAEEPEL